MLYDPLASLNEAQRDAASSINENTIVLSCPGSGKTKTVESKVAHILTSSPTATVCCTTFSKEAANEMKERIYRALPSSMSTKERNQRLRIGTFHSLCKQTIENHKKERLNIATSAEQMYHLRGAIMKLNLDRSSEAFETYRAIIDSFPTMQDEKKEQLDKSSATLYQETRDRINKSGKYTFNDLLVETVELFESGQVKPLNYTHLICDEAQDSDILMYRFLKVHADAGCLITLMLDDDQTLYSFRNSLGVSICRWMEKEANARVIENSTNYRSLEEILSPSRSLINCNINRIPKGITSFRGEGGSFNYHSTLHQGETMALLKELTQENPGDFFVLCRTNIEVQQLCLLLIAAEIPFTSNQTKNITEHKAIAAVLELLTTLEDKCGTGLDIMFHTFIGNAENHDKTLLEFEVDSLYECLSHDVSELNIQDHSHLNTKQKTSLTELLINAQAWQAAIEDRRVAMAIRAASQWVLSKQAKEEDMIVLEMIFKLLLKIKGNTIAARKMALERYFKDLAQNNNDEPEKKVLVMTAHSSKGLQRKSVIVWPVKEDSFPAAYRDGSLVTQQEHTEEERRVLYVAMTRAEDHLHLVFQQSKLNSAKSPTPYYPSEFLDEIGIDSPEEQLNL